MLSNLFVSPDSEIAVTVWISEEADGKIKAQSETPAKFDAETMDILEVVFREPTYRDVSELIDQSLALDPDGVFRMGFNKVRLERVCKLLKRWSLKDDKGKPVDPTRENIEKLQPVVAFAIIQGLEDRLGLNAPEIPEEATDESKEV